MTSKVPLYVETVAALAHRDGMGARSQPHHGYVPRTMARMSRLFRLLKMSGINFVANPLVVNIHLQGRL
ncbi:hypothetical protein KCP73_15365 [Salmonella enterica subsp. enterica]|nr:hypothetical protein KCP73_15365 [Salmonella enterica subsp. enterica]